MTATSPINSGKGKQGDRRHNDGNGRHNDSKGRHGDGKRQQGDRRHDDGDGQHDGGDRRHDDSKLPAASIANICNSFLTHRLLVRM